MGAEEGRAFYWRTLGGSNGCFSSPYQYLGTEHLSGVAARYRSASAILADARVG